jgi:chromosome partitioning protein
MPVIVAASAKGGAGKTTITAHLAVCAADGSRAVVIDTDPQASLAQWWNQREAQTPDFSAMQPGKLADQIRGLIAAGYDHVFIDTPPAMTEEIGAVVKNADLVLIPVRPSPHDLRSIGRTVDLVHEANKPFAFVLNQVKATARITGQAAAVLSQHGPVATALLADRVDFATSMTDGRTVQELDEKSRSAAEVRELWGYVKSRFAKKKK